MRSTLPFFSPGRLSQCIHLGNTLKRFFFSAVTVYFTVAALAKMFGLDLNGWANLLTAYLTPYDFAVETPFQGLRAFVRSQFGIPIPDVLCEITVLWIAIGRIVRRVIGDIADELEADAQKYNPKPRDSLTQRLKNWARHPISELKSYLSTPAVREGLVATLWWPKRLWADLKGDTVNHREHDSLTGETRDVSKRHVTIYWSLSPLRLFLYAAASFAVLGLLVAADYWWLQSGSALTLSAESALFYEHPVERDSYVLVVKGIVMTPRSDRKEDISGRIGG